MTQPASQLVTIDEVRNDINTFLKDFTQKRIADADAISPSYGELWRSIDALLQAGGKRLRPYMVALGYSATAREFDMLSILPAMAAQELFHQAILIHDDIIDRDDVRHGVLNVTGQYELKYNKYIQGTSERRHFANSAALLAGDLLISSAFQAMQQVCADPNHLRAATNTFADAIFAVSGGELLDTESAFRTDARASAETVAIHKTAHYSFVGPLVMGAQLAGAAEPTISSLKAYGEKLGIAFQMQDDLLGIYGDSGETGKSNSSDIREGKQTHLIEQFHERATSEQAALFAAVFHNATASDEAIDAARELLDQSGARSAVEDDIVVLTQQALQALDGITLDAAVRLAFVDLASRATKRSR